MTRLPPLLLRVMTALPLAGLWGCADGLLTGEPAASPVCQTAVDCGAPGVLCHEQRLCLAAAAQPAHVVVRLNPPKATGKLVEHFDFEVTADQQTEAVTLVLTDPAVVRGTVRRDKQAWPDSVSGTLVATAAGGNSGADLRYQTASYATKKMFVGSALLHGFELRLQPGLTYDVAFHPEASEQIPPHYSTLTVGGSIESWDQIVLPAADALVHVRGRLVAGDEPLVGLRVFLEDSGGRLVSTRPLSDAKGQFDLLADPASAPVRLRFEPPQSATGLPYGQLDAPIDLVKAHRVQQPVQLGKLDTGPMGLAGDVTVAVRGPDGAPEGGALVRLQQDLKPPKSGLQAHLDAHGYTASDGTFRAALRLGKAKLWVSPHVKSKAAGWQGKLQLTASATVIQCPSRRHLQGVVTDYAGRAVAAATVVLRRADAPQTAELPSGAGGTDGAELAVASSATGQFVVPVDPGSWWVWVVPAAGTHLPAALVAQVTAGSAADPPPLQVQLPAPLLLAGRVVTAAGVPLADVAIDVLAGHDPQPRQHIGRASGAMAAPPSVWDNHLLATAVSDKGGRFEVLVAPHGGHASTPP